MAAAEMPVPRDKMGVLAAGARFAAPLGAAAAAAAAEALHFERTKGGSSSSDSESAAAAVAAVAGAAAVTPGSWRRTVVTVNPRL